MTELLKKTFVPDILDCYTYGDNTAVTNVLSLYLNAIGIDLNHNLVNLIVMYLSEWIYDRAYSSMFDDNICYTMHEGALKNIRGVSNNISTIIIKGHGTIPNRDLVNIIVADYSFSLKDARCASDEITKLSVANIRGVVIYAWDTHSPQSNNLFLFNVIDGILTIEIESR